MENKFVVSIERFLRLDRFTRTSDIVRGRAVYFLAIAFILSQIVNMALMTYSFGYWTLDHTICLVVCACVVGTLIGLRYTNKFILFSSFYSVLIFGAIGMSAAIDFTGINSALIPYLLLGAIINGFISGWRSVLVFGAASFGFIWYLHSLSAGAPPGALFDPVMFETRNFQRATQASLILSLLCLVVAMASYHMHSAFFMLEAKIKEVQEIDGQRSKFLGNMSHELRTPLNGIMGFCDLLTKTSLNPQQAQYAGIVTKSADTLLAIINDALDIQKIDAGKLVLDNKSFDMRALIESIIHLYQPAAIGKGLLVGALYPDNLPQYFIGDEARIRQILNNIVNNAVKFTKDGSIYIKMEKQYDMSSDNNFILSVIDTGLGIAIKDQAIVFERFGQVDNHQSQGLDGTGLGLSLCDEIIKKMGGTFTLQSELGAGTTFTVALPLPIETKVEKNKLASVMDEIEIKDSENMEFHILRDEDECDSLAQTATENKAA